MALFEFGSVSDLVNAEVRAVSGCEPAKEAKDTSAVGPAEDAVRQVGYDRVRQALLTRL
jgi:hypothetical protein